MPIENTVEGAVPAVLDGLVADPPLTIVREALVAVQFAVLVRPGTTAAEVRTIASHPHGIAQTRGWIAAHLPDAQVLMSRRPSRRLPRSPAARSTPRCRRRWPGS